jgi:hypothetical protein
MLHSDRISYLVYTIGATLLWVLLTIVARDTSLKDFV